MSSTDVHYLMSLLNFAICSGIGYVCACRFSVMSRRTKLIFRVNYALLFTAATASGMQPIMFQEWPGVADLLSNGVVLVFIGSGMRIWRWGPPEYSARSQPVEPADYVHIVGGKK